MPLKPERSYTGLPFKQRINYKILITAFKCINNQAPEYLAELISVRNIKRELRPRGLQLYQARYNNKIHRGRAFSSAAPELWNNLPIHVRNSDNLDAFKKNLKTHLFGQAYK